MDPQADLPTASEPIASRLGPEFRPVLASLVLSGVAGLLSAASFKYPAINGSVSLLWAFGLNVCMFAWVRQDANQREYALHRWFPILMVVFGVFALLYYVFRSHKFEKAFVTLGYFVLVVLFDVILLFVAAIVGTIIMFLVFGKGTLR